MTSRLNVLLASAIAVVAAVAPAVAASQAPAPAAEMANLKVFDGSWTCEGTANPGPMGPGGAMKGTVTSQTDLNGFWQSGSVKSTAAGMPGTMEGMFHMTYDPGAKQYVLLWLDNMGAFSQATSPGWKGDTMIFTGRSSMGGQTMQVRDTFIKGEGSLKHDWEGEVEGKWMAMGTETCRKAAAAK